MSMWNKIKGFFGYSDDYYDEYYDEEYHDEDAYSEPDMTLVDSSDSYSNVVSLNKRPQLKVVLVKPERFDEANIIADHLNKKRTVVLNLEAANKDESRRLIDFLSGVAYANDGEIKRVANSTYLITPYNVDIQGDVLGELEDSGVFFGG